MTKKTAIKHSMTKTAGSESSMKYKDLASYLVTVTTKDDQNKAAFLAEFDELIASLNALETADSKNSSSDISTQELTVRIQNLVNSVQDETLLRWFVK